jgi:hypothetical protein
MFFVDIKKLRDFLAYKKILSLGVILSFLLQNVFFAHAVETHVWAERREF